MLCSLNAVTKESTTMTRRFRRSTPNPRLGPTVQLSCGDAGSSLNFFGISKRLTSQRIPSEEAPPPFLHVQPTGPFRNEHLIQPRMISQPRPRRLAVVTAQVIGDDEHISRRVGCFDLLQHVDVIG